MFGFIKFTGAAGTHTDWEKLRVDRIAVDSDGYLLFLSVIADAGQIKGINGILNTDAKVGMTTEGIEVATASRPDKPLGLNGCLRREIGYRSDKHRLGLNMVHAFYWSKGTSILLGTSDDHLWQTLRDARFTTPVLRHWVPWVKSQLIIKGALKEALCWNCNVGLLDTDTKTLDAIVSDGVRANVLTIPEKAA